MSWLSEAIQPLVEQANGRQDKEAILGAVSDYLICGNTYPLKRVWKGVIGTSGGIETKSILEDTIDRLSSYNGYRLWRAIADTIRKNGYRPYDKWTKTYKKANNRSCLKYGVLLRPCGRCDKCKVHISCEFVLAKDVRMVWRNMSERSCKVIISYAKDKWTILRPMNDAQMTKLVQSLQKTCVRLAGRKLTFLTNNDGGLSQEDFAADLVLHGVAAVREAEFTANSNGIRHNRLYIANYAKRSIHNRAMSIIEHHTAQRRARVKRTEVGVDGRKMPEYQRTTLSMDLPISMEDGEAQDFHDFLPSKAPSEAMIVEQLHLNAAINKLGDTERHILNLLMNREHNIDVEQWLWERHGATSDSLPPEAHLKALCKYFGIDYKLFCKILRKMVKGRKKIFSQPGRIHAPRLQEATDA